MQIQRLIQNIQVWERCGEIDNKKLNWIHFNIDI